MKHYVKVTMGDVYEIKGGQLRAILKVILDDERMAGHLMGITGFTGNKWLFMTTTLIGNQDYVNKVIKPAVESVAKINAMKIVDELPVINTENGRYEIVVRYTIEWDDYSEEKEEQA